MLLTPFERNLEVWRQLWRVVERSHLIVQIVDARNPLRFRCEDLERYVGSMGIMGAGSGKKAAAEREEGDEEEDEEERGEETEGSGKRRSLLLINKSDLLTLEQRYASSSLLQRQIIAADLFFWQNSVGRLL